MILKELYPGDRIREPYSNILFTVAGKNPYGEGVLLITDKVIAMGAMDAPEPESERENDRITGCNDYILSNLDQWLNSDQDDWFQKSHETDTPPSEEYLSIRPTLFDPIGHNAYDKKPGFLTCFPASFRDRICESVIPSLDPKGEHLRQHRARVFCPSAAELGLPVGVMEEGKELPLFRDFRMRYASPSEECLMESEWFPAYFRSHRMFWYWLRTPNVQTDGFVAYSHFVNPFAYKFACSPWMGIRPMLSLDEGVNIAPAKGSWGIYRFDA